MSPGSDRLPLFVVTAPGLEDLAREELRELGVSAVAEPGGVAWEGTREELYAANLRLRTASRVLVRVAEFRARTFFELERHARRVEWERFVEPGSAVGLRVTTRKSRLYHQGAVAQRVREAIEHRCGSVRTTDLPGAEEGEEAEGTEEQLFVVRFLHDRCTISADSSGALLHLRGYRQALARAPLRETLAAACLLGSGWRGDAPLLDPMCGSGTLVMEGALLARRIAPGLAGADREPRRFAFQRWPDFEADLWDRTVAAARAEIRPAPGVPLLGSDRDAGAIEAARSNAERAGVLSDLELSVRPVSAVEPPPGPGWLVTNPPYGARVGETRALRDLYAGLGNVARRSLAGWTLAMLAADPKLEAQVGIPFREAIRTRNGGIPVRLVVGRVP
jgi:putative N6-adenine-specific DNA methylase